MEGKVELGWFLMQGCLMRGISGRNSEIGSGLESDTHEFSDFGVGQAIETRDQHILHLRNLHGNVYCIMQMDTDSQWEPHHTVAQTPLRDESLGEKRWKAILGARGILMECQSQEIVRPFRRFRRDWSLGIPTCCFWRPRCIGASHHCSIRFRRPEGTIMVQVSAWQPLPAPLPPMGLETEHTHD